jgi:hypothetical protein
VGDIAGKWSISGAQHWLSRRYIIDDLPLAKWMEERRSDGVLSLLLVINPTGDLEGADAEGERIRKIASSIPSLKLTELVHERATRAAVRSALESGKYECASLRRPCILQPGGSG